LVYVGLSLGGSRALSSGGCLRCCLSVVVVERPGAGACPLCLPLPCFLLLLWVLPPTMVKGLLTGPSSCPVGALWGMCWTSRRSLGRAVGTPPPACGRQGGCCPGLSLPVSCLACDGGCLVPPAALCCRVPSLCDEQSRSVVRECGLLADGEAVQRSANHLGIRLDLAARPCALVSVCWQSPPRGGGASPFSAGKSVPPRECVGPGDVTRRLPCEVERARVACPLAGRSRDDWNGTERKALSAKGPPGPGSDGPWGRPPGGGK
jgi:hypothetical protein